jgi:phosphodiesterase/alkaline phosphatase D-like protein
LPNSPTEQLNRAFGALVYGRLLEMPIFDCAGHLTLEGDRAGLIPESVEKWLINRTVQSSAVHFALAPSHPFGWTAGKWREWYPDVVAPEGFEGIVTNELMSDTAGRLTVKAQKYLWQKGWWNQHQRLLKTLAERPASRFILSGDIHAQGAVEISKSGSLDLTKKLVKSVLVGPVGTSEATWPSSARGIVADEPAWMETSALAPTQEVNGFTLFEFNSAGATATLFDCGGYDLSKGEDGRVLHTVELGL